MLNYIQHNWEITFLFGAQTIVLLLWIWNSISYKRNIARMNVDFLRESAEIHRRFVAETARLRLDTLEDLKVVEELRRYIEGTHQDEKIALNAKRTKMEKKDG